MKYYQVIDIINEEPLKIGSNGNKASWTEPCKDFIPGSTLRGAMIAQMLQYNICSADKLAPILQNMSCYNAYPFNRNDRCLYFPAPQHLRMDKHEGRKAIAQGTDTGLIGLTNLLKPRTDKSIYTKTENGEETAKNHLLYQYVAIQDSHLQGMRISKAYHQHHSQKRNIDKQEKENLFSYQAIQPGYTFRTVIMFDEQIYSEVTKLLKKSTLWYLGGSKGSGYGKSRITVVGDPIDSFDEVKKLIYAQAGGVKEALWHSENRQESDQLIITCLSDCLYRNEFGQPIHYIPERVFHELLGTKVSLKLVRQFVQSSLSEGFNAKWFARYPKEATIKAGSVFVYEFSSEVPKEARQKLIAALESQPRGQRVQDGFGWLAVNLPYPEVLAVAAAKGLQESSVRSYEKNELALSTSSPIQHLNTDEMKVISIIQKGLRDMRKQWLQMIVKRSIGAEKVSKDKELIFSSKIKSSQCSNMQEIIEKWSKLKVEQRSSWWNEYQKRLSRDYANDNTYCSIAGCNFNEIIYYLTNDRFDQRNRAKLDRLRMFAQQHLNSSSGRLYYEDSQSEDVQKVFIAELLNEGLHYNLRRCKHE